MKVSYCFCQPGLRVHRTVFFLGLSSVFLFLGCAKKSGQSDVKPASSSKAGGVDAQAAELELDKLSEYIDALENGKAIDRAWLENALDQVLAKDPKNILAQYNKAVLLERAGRVAEAEAEYQRIAKDSPDFAPAQENYAAKLVEAGEVDKAIGIYRDVLEDNPKNVTSRLAMARIELRQKRYKKAIDISREALERKADAIEAFRVLARAYVARGDLLMAELVIGRGLKLDKKDAELGIATADILLERGDLPGAIAQLKGVIAHSPERLDVRARLANISMDYQDFGNAASHYEAILAKMPEHRQAKVGLAVALKGQGRYPESKAIYDELLAKNARDADALWNVGVLYERYLLDYDKAISTFVAYRDAVASGDERAAKVEDMVAELRRQKADVAAIEAREAKERARQAAIAKVCEVHGAGGKPDFSPLGEEQARVEIAWQLLFVGRDKIAASDLVGGEAEVACAFAIIPKTEKSKIEACAPMHVEWTQTLYQLDRIPEAMSSIDAALRCDPSNPDALLIKEQLAEIVGSTEG